MKNRKAIVIAVLLAAVVVLPIATIAKPGKKRGLGMGMGQGGGMDIGMQFPLELLLESEVAKAINLTDAQEEKIGALITSTQKTDIRTMADMQILRVELMDLLQDDNASTAQVDKKIDEMTVLHGKMMKSKVHMLLEAKKILTEEQVEKIKELIRDKMGAKRGKQGKGKGKGMRGMMPGGEDEDDMAAGFGPGGGGGFGPGGPPEGGPFAPEE